MKRIESEIDDADPVDSQLAALAMTAVEKAILRQWVDVTPPAMFAQHVIDKISIRNKLNADADKSGASEKDEPTQCRAVSCQERGQRVNKNTGCHHKLASEPIGECTTDQSKNPTAQGGNPKQSPSP